MKKILAFLTVLAMLMASPLSVNAREGDETMIYGKMDVVSSYESGKFLKDSFYYTDDWFDDDPEKQNDALALMSMQAVASVIDADENGACAALLKKLGFKNIEFFNFETNDPDDCAFVKAEKTLPSGGRLIAVVIQSYTLDNAIKKKGWTQNFVVNGDTIEPEHAAFAKAADKALEDIKDDTDLYTKYWIMGQSRGGAIANIMATRLPEKYTYAYTFESPATTSDETAASGYKYIHNYLCSDDVVTMIPPWGMTRYGQTHNIDVTLDISEELQKLQSKISTVKPEGGEEEKARDLIDALEAVATTRESYSEAIAIPDGSGETHTYQEAMANLLSATFGGGFKGLDIYKIYDNIDEFNAYMDSLVKALLDRKEGKLEESEQGLWTASKNLNDFLELLLPKGSDNPLSQKDMFMILKLAGDALIDTTTIYGEDSHYRGLDYLSPATGIMAGLDELLYSHQFDSLIARLKVMASAPKLESIDATIDNPSQGDAASKAIAELEEAIDSEFSPEISWFGSDETLQDNKLYNLKVVLHAPGRSVDGFTMKINGQEPVDGLNIKYVDGEYVIKGIWTYTLGTPEKVKVNFDCGGKTSDPEAIEVDRGTLLSIEIADVISNPDVILDKGKHYRFDGWFKDGMSWEDILADEDLTLTAKWQQLIDRIDITFKAPKVGDKPSSPTISSSANYIINADIYDVDWNEMIIALKKKYTVCIDIVSKDMPFFAKISDDEEVDSEYLGEVYVNGKKMAKENISYSYDEYEDMETVYVSFQFTPAYKKAPAAKYLPLKPKSTKQGKKSITLNWKTSKKASKYVIYGAAKSGKSMKKLKTVKGSKYTVKKIAKKLKKGTFYKFYITAKDKYGNIVFKTKTIYVATKGKKNGNYKSVQIRVKNKVKKKATVKKGKTLKIKAKGIKPKKSTVIVKGVGMRYESSNTKIATVSKKGTIKGKKKGTCTIYAYAPNGIYKTIKITVK